MNNPGHDQTRRQQLSALMDGESDAPSLAAACACWREEPSARRDWHDWHLIGDVLRSDDLACDPQRDAAFVAAVRERLAGEPVVVAPFEQEARPSRVPRPAATKLWVGGVAAGLALVAGALVLTAESPPATPALVARTPAAAPADGLPSAADASGAAGSTLAATSAQLQVVPAGEQLFRDARLDRYLAAHRLFVGTPAPAPYSGFVRPAVAEAAPR